MSLQKIKIILLDYIEKLRDSDFGWINFSSGIMIAAAVNIFTGFCVTENPSYCQLLASICALVASLCLFMLYQKLSYISRSIRREIDLYSDFLTSKDREVHEKAIWREEIKSNWIVFLLCAVGFVISILIMIGFLILTYLYYNNGSCMECCFYQSCLK